MMNFAPIELPIPHVIAHSKTATRLNFKPDFSLFFFPPPQSSLRLQGSGIIWHLSHNSAKLQQIIFFLKLGSGTWRQSEEPIVFFWRWLGLFSEALAKKHRQNAKAKQARQTTDYTKSWKLSVQHHQQSLCS